MAVDEIKNVANMMKNANDKCKILISSVLPQRNDRIMNNAIRDTYAAMKEICEECNYTFINNDNNFIKDSKPDFTMKKNTVNLNTRCQNTWP